MMFNNRKFINFNCGFAIKLTCGFLGETMNKIIQTRKQKLYALLLKWKSLFCFVGVGLICIFGF